MMIYDRANYLAYMNSLFEIIKYILNKTFYEQLSTDVRNNCIVGLDLINIAMHVSQKIKIFYYTEKLISLLNTFLIDQIRLTCMLVIT